MLLTPGPLTKRVTYWQKIMCLDHWDIGVRLADELDNNGAVASCNVWENYDRATITFVRNLKEVSELKEPLDNAIVHELLHVHGRGVEEVFQATVRGCGSQEGYALRDRWTHEDEGLIYRLTKIIVDLHK